MADEMCLWRLVYKMVGSAQYKKCIECDGYNVQCGEYLKRQEAPMLSKLYNIPVADTKPKENGKGN